MADDAAEFLRALGIDRAHVCGFSGAAHGPRARAAPPELVRSLARQHVGPERLLLPRHDLGVDVAAGRGAERPAMLEASSPDLHTPSRRERDGRRDHRRGARLPTPSRRRRSSASSGRGSRTTLRPVARDQRAHARCRRRPGHDHSPRYGRIVADRIPGAKLSSSRAKRTSPSRKTPRTSTVWSPTSGPTSTAASRRRQLSTPSAVIAIRPTTGHGPPAPRHTEGAPRQERRHVHQRLPGIDRADLEQARSQRHRAVHRAELRRRRPSRARRDHRDRRLPRAYARLMGAFPTPTSPSTTSSASTTRSPPASPSGELHTDNLSRIAAHPTPRATSSWWRSPRSPRRDRRRARQLPTPCACSRGSASSRTRPGPRTDVLTPPPPDRDPVQIPEAALPSARIIPDPGVVRNQLERSRPRRTKRSVLPMNAARPSPAPRQPAHVAQAPTEQRAIKIRASSSHVEACAPPSQD